jgi:hypothetical protein
VKIVIELGLLCKSLVDQFEQHGILITDDIRKWDDNNNSIDNLQMSQLLTDAEAEKVRKRLLKKILSHKKKTE